MQKYVYSGPVLEFNKLISSKWEGSTYAISESKARSNLAYQFKKNHNRMPNASIKLPGTLMVY